MQQPDIIECEGPATPDPEVTQAVANLLRDAYDTCPAFRALIDAKLDKVMAKRDAA